MKQAGNIWVFYDGNTKTQSKPLSLTQAQALILNLLKLKSKNIFVWTPGKTEWTELNQFLKSKQKFFALPPTFNSEDLVVTDVEKTVVDAVTSVDDKTIVITNQPNLDDTAIAFQEAKNTFTEAHIDDTQKKVDYGYFFPDFKAEQIDLRVNHLVKIISPGPSSKNSNVASVESDRRDRMRFNFKLEVHLISKTGKTFKSESDNISLGGIKLMDKIPKEYISMDFSLIIINKLEKDSKKARIHFKTKCVGDILDPCRLVFVNPDKKNKELLENMIDSYIKQSKIA
ncbi:MAG: PilZ domain-containing protein [Deltaproteobacteria bacterium]|jgi:hypothetical protein|nr:PilZ domain-containing protein [Deltaproteobacteria bacterium]